MRPRPASDGAIRDLAQSAVGEAGPFNVKSTATSLVVAPVPDATLTSLAEISRFRHRGRKWRDPAIDGRRRDRDRRWHFPSRTTKPAQIASPSSTMKRAAPPSLWQELQALALNSGPEPVGGIGRSRRLHPLAVEQRLADGAVEFVRPRSRRCGGGDRPRR